MFHVALVKQKKDVNTGLHVGKKKCIEKNSNPRVLITRAVGQKQAANE